MLPERSFSLISPDLVCSDGIRGPKVALRDHYNCRDRGYYVPEKQCGVAELQRKPIAVIKIV